MLLSPLIFLNLHKKKILKIIKIIEILGKTKPITVTLLRYSVFPLHPS